MRYQRWDRDGRGLRLVYGTASRSPKSSGAGPSRPALGRVLLLVAVGVAAFAFAYVGFWVLWIVDALVGGGR